MTRPMTLLLLPGLFCLGLAACGGPDADRPAKYRLSLVGGAPATECEVTARSRALPADVRETSGLARSPRTAGLFWTHNDSGNEPILFGLDEDGRIVARVRIEGARFEDWEDLAAAGCPEGNCLLLGDIGDNHARRNEVAVHLVAEPGREDRGTRVVRSLRAAYPDGPQDAEAVFGHRGETYVVTKGRHGPIGLYQFPPASGSAGKLRKVRELWPQPADRRDWVTGATTTPDGRWVVVRTYGTLHFFTAGDLLNGKGPAARFDLTALDIPQGEAIAVANNGTVWLTSEAKRKKDLPEWSRLSCRLPSSR